MNEDNTVVKERKITFEYSTVNDCTIKPGTIFFIDQPKYKPIKEALEKFIYEDSEYYSRLKIDMPGGPSHSAVAHYLIRKFGWVCLFKLSDNRIKARPISKMFTKKILETKLDVIIVRIQD